ncbi:MAG: Hydantoinase/oxoprolinase [Candidatus Syntrophoarchaeum sp. GoM_oil]|nr:MAG: Hydantoinase/oxoprolinase [Candidatus Syntrophoarchaeum sp. GoM_oil]
MTAGMDIGGANTKIASSEGYTASFYLPIWKGADLTEVLKSALEELHPSKVGITLTCELADSFLTRGEGVLHITEIVSDLIEDALFFSIDGTFHDQVYVKKYPEKFFASNWLASSLFLGKELGDTIFVDMGSTTTDIIPIVSGKPVAGVTDFERLKKGEMVYTGLLRTNVATILDRIRVDGSSCRLASEQFGISADAYLLLGKIVSEDYTCDTPNAYAEEGSGKTKEDASRRIARVVCSDLPELGMENIYRIADEIALAQKNQIKEAIGSISRRYGLTKVVCGGVGAFVISEASEELGLECILLAERYGKEISDIFPAYAVAKLLE